MARVKPFRAVRYDERAGGAARARWSRLRTTCSAPRSGRATWRESPYNVVHLTLPDDEQRAAARSGASGRPRACSSRDDEPALLVARAGLRRPGRRRADARRARLRAAGRAVLGAASCSRTSARTRARRRGACACCARCARTSSRSSSSTTARSRAPAASRCSTSSSRASATGSGASRARRRPELADAQLLIADGHHRYETALAFHEEDGTEESAWLLAVVVPTAQEGLTIFPTHRLADGVDVSRRRARPTSRRSSCSAAATGRSSTAAAATYVLGATGRELDAAPSSRCAADGPLHAAGRGGGRRGRPRRGRGGAARAPADDRAGARRSPARRDDAAEEHLLLSRSSPRACCSCLCDRLVRDLPRGGRGRAAACSRELPTRAEREPVVGARRRRRRDDRDRRGGGAGRRRAARRGGGRLHARLGGARDRAARGGATYVVVDPIDGSINAKRGIPFFSLSIAVADGPTMDDVHFGYVYDFGSGEEWTAVRGEGASLDGEPLGGVRAEGADRAARDGGDDDRARRAPRAPPSSASRTGSGSWARSRSRSATSPPAASTRSAR